MVVVINIVSDNVVKINQTSIILVESPVLTTIIYTQVARNQFE